MMKKRKKSRYKMNIPVADKNNEEQKICNRQEMTDEDTYQAITGEEDKSNKINEPTTGVSELGNFSDNNNTLGEITGVEENEHANIESVLEEENDPDKYMTLGDINITSHLIFLKERRDGTINPSACADNSPKEYTQVKKIQAHPPYK